MAAIDKVQVQIGKEILFVTGGSFRDIIEAVKEIEGRRWNGQRKVWVLPCSLDEARAALAENGFQVGGDDQVLDAEIEAIEQVRCFILCQQDEAESIIAALNSDLESYARGSKSSRKYAIAQDRDCLQYALRYAAMQLERLTEPQIATIRRAARMLRGEEKIHRRG